jgi:hypothetical protein
VHANFRARANADRRHAFGCCILGLQRCPDEAQCKAACETPPARQTDADDSLETRRPVADRFVMTCVGSRKPIGNTGPSPREVGLDDQTTQLPADNVTDVNGVGCCRISTVEPVFVAAGRISTYRRCSTPRL